MPMKRVCKEALIGETIIFNSLTDDETDRIFHSHAMNHIDIISLDGLTGDPVIPTDGLFKIYARTDVDGGFKMVTTNGSMDATITGGSLLDDGVAVGAVLIGFPLEIKITPIGVIGAVAYRVDIKQSSVQLDNPTVTTDPSLETGKGNTPGHSFVAIVGHNPACSSTNFDDIWGGGGNMVLPTAAEELEIFSDDSRDTNGGDGAWAVLVTTLDPDMDPLAPQVVLLNGTTPVTIPLGVAHFRMHHLTPTSGGFVLSAGDVSVNPMESNIGKITIRAVGSGLIRSVIMPMIGKCEDAHVSPPAGFSIFGLRNLLAWPEGQSGDIVLTLKSRAANSARISTGRVPIYQQPENIIFEAKNRGTSALDRALRAKSTNEGASLTTITEYEMVDDNYL